MKNPKYQKEAEAQSKQIQSLAGKVNKNIMGSRDQKSKPKRSTQSKKQSLSQNISFKGGNVLQQQFDETIIYRPKTQENKLKFQNFLGRLYRIVTDLPESTFKSVADEILAILKSDQNQIQKKASMQAIVGIKVQQQPFLDLINVVKSITDYKVEQQIERMQQDIAIKEEDESEQDGEIYQQVQQIQDEALERGPKLSCNQSGSQQQSADKQNKDVIVDANQVDAHWLHHFLCKNDIQVTEAQRIQPQVLSALSADTKLQAENILLGVLSIDKYHLIKTLLTNREVIYLCTMYHRTQNQKEKQHFLEIMKSKNISFAGNKKSKPQKNDQKNIKKQTIEHQMQQQQIHVAELVKDQDILRINKSLLSLKLHDTTDLTFSKQQYKFQLPSGATKTPKQGYQQIHIPPSISKKQQQLIDISSLQQWMQPVFQGVQRLNPIQSRVHKHTLHSNKNMLVCAPTSAGKTNIALMAILKVIGDHRNSKGVIDVSKFKVVYIAPMKALVSEITGNLANRLKVLNINVKELTGDMSLTKAQIEQTQIIVSTPEKWDIVTRKAGDRLFTQQIRLMIIDEIHLLSDSRGPVLQSLIARAIRQSERQSDVTKIRIVGLSATLPNYKDVGATLRVTPKNGLFYFDQSYRPVPLSQYFCGVTQKKGVRKMLMINQILYEKVIDRVADNQMIIFVHSRRDTVKTANYLKDTAYSKNESYKILKPESESKKILQSIVQAKDGTQSQINSQDLKNLLANGIGIHHAGLSRSDRNMVQQLFANRNISILVSTATLAWGVNLPAHTVIIKGTQVYSPEQGRWIQLTLQDVLQMLGRAGRPKYDDKGEGIIISGYDEIRYYLSMLNMQTPLQSQMIKSLADQLNAQIVLGAVNNLKQGANWLGYTYLYVRMLKNPKYYSIPLDQIEEDPELLRRRVNLIHSAAVSLQKNGLVNYDRRSGTFNSTFLGKISSYYYINYDSMAIYNTNLKPNIGLIQLFKIFSMSKQFQYLSVRQQQKVELQKLMQSVPVPIKGTLQDSTSKISVLLQAHISNLHLQGYALNVDKAYVTQSASRIMRALFQIGVKRGWGQVAQKCLQLAKMIDKRMWSCMNPLRQFEEVPEYVVGRLEKKQQFSWELFYQMTPQQIQELTKMPHLGKILHKLVHFIPRVQINAYAQPITRSCLKVDLTVKNDFKWDGKYHGKQQNFWLFVLDCNEDNLLFSYYFSLSEKQDTFFISFIVPLFQILHPLYFIKVVSDRWVCSDNILPLSFKSMILPNKFPSPNQILDMQPLPVSNALAKQLKISFLNQIQTQSYNSFVNSDKNVFLGASQGSGKFTLALFAINKCLQSRKKAIIMLPFKSLMIRKVEQLSKIFQKFSIAMTCQDLAKDSANLQKSDILVTTPQAWDVLIRRWKNRKGFDKIGLFIVDSLHLLFQNYSIMQVVVSRMRYISSQLQQNQFRIIGLSSSVANYLNIAQWIGAPSENTYNFHPNVRQNSVQIVFSSYDQNVRESRIHMMQKYLINNVKHYNRNAIVFVDDRKQAKLTSLDFVSILSTQQNPHRLRKLAQNQMKVFLNKIGDLFLARTLQYGIGYIFQGMNEIQKQIVTKLFQIEAIGILVVSHGLKWQMGSTKAFIVGVMECSYFDCKNKRWSDYSIPDVIQMMSLASVWEKDKNKGKQYHSAKFLMMCHGPKKGFYKKFLSQPYPVQSSLNLNLANYLNASISIKQIKSKSDCIDWITWTFFYRRLTLNPNFYNMSDLSSDGVSSHLSQLIQNTIEYMQGIKCIEVDDDQNSVSSTNLGIIASYYYIKVETIGMFVQKVSENMKLHTLFQAICESQEMKSISYRPGEYQSIGERVVGLREKPINKVHALLLIYLNRLQTTSEIRNQIKYIVPLCVKMCQVFVDIIATFGFLKPLFVSMNLCQMLVQSVYINDSQLLQIMDKQTANELQNKLKIKSINQFLSLDEDVQNQAFKNKQQKQIDKIASACNRYPNISLQVQVISQEQDKIQIQVAISREDCDDEMKQKDYVVICPYFPSDQKHQYWWIIVGDKSTNKVLATKRVLLKQTSKNKVQFQPVEGVQNYSIYAICDSYLGCDQKQDIKVQIQIEAEPDEAE